MKPTRHSIRLQHRQLEQLISLAQSASPDESCGLISGIAGQAQRIIPVENIAPEKRVAFQMQPAQLLKAYQQIDDMHQSILAIYHSHPASSPIPSQQDIEHTREHYPDIPQIIISLQKPTPEIKVWLISRDHVQASEAIVGKEIEFEVPLLEHTTIERVLFFLILLIGVCILLGASLLLLPPAPVLGTT